MRVFEVVSPIVGLTLVLMTSHAFAAAAGQKDSWVAGAVVGKHSGARTKVNAFLEDQGLGRLVIGAPGAGEHFVLFQSPGDAEGWSLVFHDCSVGDEADEYVIAIAKPEPEREFLDHVYFAWRIDPVANLAIAIPARGVVCRNESYGV
ncbi:MAG: hypothetical protein KF911_08740 [Pseudomonadales bacterium]|nr:hypothetical protein [Pseudomonadales bacterium]